MIVKLKISNFHELKKDFPTEKDYGYKKTFSSYKIRKGLMDEINKDFEKGKIEMGYLVDYDTSFDRHCIFHLKGLKITDDIRTITCEYSGTIR